MLLETVAFDATMEGMLDSAQTFWDEAKKLREQQQRKFKQVLPAINPGKQPSLHN